LSLQLIHSRRLLARPALTTAAALPLWLYRLNRSAGHL